MSMPIILHVSAMQCSQISVLFTTYDVVRKSQSGHIGQQPLFNPPMVSPHSADLVREDVARLVPGRDGVDDGELEVGVAVPVEGGHAQHRVAHGRALQHVRRVGRLQRGGAELQRISFKMLLSSHYVLLSLCK